jgi:hypothetical protein
MKGSKRKRIVVSKTSEDWKPQKHWMQVENQANPNGRIAGRLRIER